MLIAILIKTYNLRFFLYFLLLYCFVSRIEPITMWRLTTGSRWKIVNRFEIHDLFTGWFTFPLLYLDSHVGSSYLLLKALKFFKITPLCNILFLWSSTSRQAWHWFLWLKPYQLHLIDKWLTGSSGRVFNIWTLPCIPLVGEHVRATFFWISPQILLSLDPFLQLVTTF